MLKELDAVKDLLEEEYRSYSAQLSEAKDFLSEQEKKIREQERFIAVLEQEKETKGEFLSAYNNDDTVLHRIEEENMRKQKTVEDCASIRDKISELSEKTEKYRIALEQLNIVNQEDHMIVSGQLMKETDEALNDIAVQYTKGLKEFTKTVEEYMYMDPERVKIELQKYTKENKAYVNKVKEIRKRLNCQVKNRENQIG